MQSNDSVNPAVSTSSKSHSGSSGESAPRAEGSAWISLTDEDRDRAFNTLPDMLEGFMKKWGWLHFAKAIEDICREKNEKRDNPPPTPNVYDEEWVCEEHPEKPMGHDGCKGAGMLSDESIKRLGIAGRDGGRSNG